MPAQADPDLALRLAKAVADVYGEAAQRMLEVVAGRLARGVDEPGWAERKLLEQVALRDQAQVIVDKLATAGPAAVETAVRQAFEQGASDGAAELGTAMGRTNTHAVDALVREAVSGVTSTHGQILRTALDAYREVIAHTAAPGVVTGTVTTRQAAQQALNRLADQGITGFRDRAGRRWELESYTEMATRTAAGRAQVDGTLDQFVADGRDLVIVSDAPEECRVCRPWEGKVLSISGRTPGYPSVTEARNAGLLHANCRHALRAYVPGLTRKMTHTADPHGDAIRQEQRALERAKRQALRRQAVAIDEPAAKAARARVTDLNGRLKAITDDRHAYAQSKADALRARGHRAAADRWQRVADGIEPGTPGKRLRYRERPGTAGVS